MSNGKINWAEIVTMEDLPERYRLEVAEIIGLDAAITLAEKQGGLGAIYIPQLSSLLTAKKEEYIRKNFNGCNHRELALATGYTERWIYEVLKKKPENEEQMELFAGAKR